MSQTPYERLEVSLQTAGTPAAFDELARICRETGQLPQLFEALLMKKRAELGLPLLGADTFRDLPPDLQRQVEDYYVEVCKEVGKLYLERGDLQGAWPYFRAIDEPEAVAAALDAWRPPDANDSQTYDANGNTQTDVIIDIALHQGANPRRGYELVLSQYGVCRAITILEHQFPHPAKVREACGALLVRRLHADLLSSLKADIQRREAEPPAGSDIRKLVEARPWLFEDHGYHMDLSHLQSGVRVASGLEDKEVLGLALDLTEYGRRLPRDFQSHDAPPFDDFYNDYRIFFQALLGIGADGAARYFTQKADRASPEEDGKHFPGEILVHLLWRTGRYEEAIRAFLKYLKSYRGQLTAAPPLLELCERAGRYEALLELARERGDLLHFTAGLVRRAGVETRD